MKQDLLTIEDALGFIMLLCMVENFHNKKYLDTKSLIKNSDFNLPLTFLIALLKYN